MSTINYNHSSIYNSTSSVAENPVDKVTLRFGNSMSNECTQTDATLGINTGSTLVIQSTGLTGTNTRPHRTIDQYSFNESLCNRAIEILQSISVNCDEIDLTATMDGLYSILEVLWEDLPDDNYLKGEILATVDTTVPLIPNKVSNKFELEDIVSSAIELFRCLKLKNLVEDQANAAISSAIDSGSNIFKAVLGDTENCDEQQSK
ncbi:MAG: hypothetical protein JKX85_12025 [Phycisphaeraceae bacterium]|nr:hypothetical protein [Phycisphaeraceae bacterium]